MQKLRSTCLLLVPRLGLCQTLKIKRIKTYKNKKVAAQKIDIMFLVRMIETHAVVLLNAFVVVDQDT